MSQPLPEPTLFLDECLGARLIPQRLRDEGIQVEVLVDHFAAGTADDVWLPVVGQRGWVVVTKDAEIRRRTNEMAALRSAGVAAFILRGKNMTGQDMAEAIAKGHPRIRKLLRKFEPPFLATISPSGRIELLGKPPRRAASR